ncbi:MAG: hypothetical protein O3C63_02895 [Cyanobacteria bacterium]|nr:hypothetical protein [Cyanobacteriota bacterium]
MALLPLNYKLKTHIIQYALKILSSHLPEFTGPLLYQDPDNPQAWQNNFGNY